MVHNQRETDSELRDRLIVLVRGEIHRVQGNHTPSPGIENVVGDIERAIVKGIESIFKEREGL